MKVLLYAVREVWSRFKGASLTADAPPVHAYALASLAKWAEHEAGSPGGPPRGLREALAASISGAALVDAAVEKLAEQGRYTPEEKEFLLDLNAEAALRDLRQLLKTSSAFGDALRSPTLRGAVAGGVIGGGLGAWKDDDNRLRGALSYGVPGAAIGAVAGHGYGTWSKARQLAGEEQARKLVDDMHALDDHNIRHIEGQEWAKAQDAAHTQGLRDATSDARAATDDFNVKKIQGQAWAQAQDAAHATQQAALASQTAKQSKDAQRWFDNLLQSAALHATSADQDTAFHATQIYKALQTHEKHIVEHAKTNPEAIHRTLIGAAGVDKGSQILHKLVAHAKTLHKNGN